MCCANERNIVGPRFDDRETIEMLALVGSEVWPETSSNNFQQGATTHNIKLGPTMLRHGLVGQQCCERLHGPLDILSNIVITLKSQNLKSNKVIIIIIIIIVPQLRRLFCSGILTVNQKHPAWRLFSWITHVTNFWHRPNKTRAWNEKRYYWLLTRQKLSPFGTLNRSMLG